MPRRLSEECTRKELIDPQLEKAGWYLHDNKNMYRKFAGVVARVITHTNRCAVTSSPLGGGREGVESGGGVV
jgi:hypothetical protein